MARLGPRHLTPLPARQCLQPALGSGLPFWEPHPAPAAAPLASMQIESPPPLDPRSVQVGRRSGCCRSGLFWTCPSRPQEPWLVQLCCVRPTQACCAWCPCCCPLLPRQPPRQLPWQASGRPSARRATTVSGAACVDQRCAAVRAELYCSACRCRGSLPAPSVICRGSHSCVVYHLQESLVPKPGVVGCEHSLHASSTP